MTLRFNGEPSLGGTVNVSIQLANNAATAGANLGSFLVLLVHC